jgi:carbon storage regulator
MMLVLRRSRGQSIIIDAHEKITIKVLREDNGVVSLGIDAPKSVSVDRLEVYLKRQANIESSALSEQMEENQESRIC